MNACVIWPRLGLAALTLLAAASCPAAPTASTAQGEAAFQNFLHRLDSAEKRKSVAAWAALLRANSMPYFTLNAPGQPHQSLAQAVSGERAFLSTMKSIDVDTEQVDSFDISGNLASAVVTARNVSMVVDDTGEIGPRGASHKFDVTSRITYSLIWSRGGWKIQSVTEAPLSISVDGKSRPLQSS